MTVSPPELPVTAARVAETAPVPALTGVRGLSAPIPDPPPVAGVASTGALVGAKFAVRLCGPPGDGLEVFGALPLDGVERLPPAPAPVLVPALGPAPVVPPLPVVL